MFRAHVLIIMRSKLYYTASGIITPIGLMIPEAVQCNFDLLMMSTCSKHVEAWNKLIVKQKFCASSLLITETNILRCTVSKMSKSMDRYSWNFNFCIFFNHIEKIQALLKREHNKRSCTLHVDLYTCMTLSRWHLFRMKNVSYSNCREYPTHSLRSKKNYFSEVVPLSRIHG